MKSTYAYVRGKGKGKDVGRPKERVKGEGSKRKGREVKGGLD